MKTEYPFLFSFLYNWAADYILLLFVKKDLYPEIKNRTILIGASACSLSYILWEGTAGKLPPYCRIILKWFLIFSILYILFKIRSVKRMGKTISLFLCSSCNNHSSTHCRSEKNHSRRATVAPDFQPDSAF